MLNLIQYRKGALDMYHILYDGERIATLSKSSHSIRFVLESCIPVEFVRVIGNVCLDLDRHLTVDSYELTCRDDLDLNIMVNAQCVGFFTPSTGDVTFWGEHPIKACTLIALGGEMYDLMDAEDQDPEEGMLKSLQPIGAEWTS